MFSVICMCVIVSYVEMFVCLFYNLSHTCLYVLCTSTGHMFGKDGRVVGVKTRSGVMPINTLTLACISYPPKLKQTKKQIIKYNFSTLEGT